MSSHFSKKLANSNSKWLYQRKPYVKHKVNGKYLDKNGNPIAADLPEAHIPLNEYNFKKLAKAVPYE